MTRSSLSFQIQQSTDAGNSKTFTTTSSESGEDGEITAAGCVLEGADIHAGGSSAAITLQPFTVNGSDMSDADGNAVSFTSVHLLEVSLFWPVTYASGTATSSGTNVSDGDTYIVGGVTYTAAVAPSTGNEYLIGGSAAASLSNLGKAINQDGDAGVDYASGMSPNPEVRASVNSLVLTVTARESGSVGNAIAQSETGTTLTVSGANLTGGVSPAAAEVDVTATNFGSTGADGDWSQRIRVSADKPNAILIRDSVDPVDGTTTLAISHESGSDEYKLAVRVVGIP